MINFSYQDITKNLSYKFPKFAQERRRISLKQTEQCTPTASSYTRCWIIENRESTEYVCHRVVVEKRESFNLTKYLYDYSIIFLVGSLDLGVAS